MFGVSVFILKDSANNSRRKRGPTRALDVLLLPKGQKIKVMNNELGQAIGDNANKLSSFMGTLARNGCIAPLTYKDWRMMPQIHKDKMWNCILVYEFIFLSYLCFFLVNPCKYASSES